MTDLCDLSAGELINLLGGKRVSPVELLESCLNRTKRINPAVNAIVTIDEEGAREAAQEAEKAIMAGRAVGPLHGIPVAIKDTEDTAGMRTTYGSPLFANHVPNSDLAVVGRLRSAGAILFAKTNTPEWAAGGNTRNPVHGATGNAFNPTLSAAGSSGGSAVALACGMTVLASGSDTGGSLRNPAAYSGIVGMRPSPGLVAHERRPYGWSSLSVNGPMGRNVVDAAIMLEVMSSDDARDPLAYALPGRNVRAGGAYRPQPLSLQNLRVGITPDLGFAPTEGSIRRAFDDKMKALAPLFGRMEEASPDCTDADDCFAVLRAAQFLAQHGEQYRNQYDQIGPNIKANVEEGLKYSLNDYAQAARIQTKIYRSFIETFNTYDILLTPSVTISPRPWRELYPVSIDGQETRSYYHWLALAYGVTLGAHPAISLPLGVDRTGMPFGLQIVGRRGGDAQLMSVARAIEKELEGDPSLGRPSPDFRTLESRSPIAHEAGFFDWE